jgi:hypothetical protein
VLCCGCDGWVGREWKRKGGKWLEGGFDFSRGVVDGMRI